MTARKPALVALLLALTFLGWSCEVLAQDTHEATAGRSAPGFPGSSGRGLQGSPSGLVDERGGDDWSEPPWAQAQRNWIKQQSARLREAMRERQSAMEQWRDARDRWLNPYGQWIQDLAQSRRLARESYERQVEDWYKRMRARPLPGQPWGAGPRLGSYPGR